MLENKLNNSDFPSDFLVLIVVEFKVLLYPESVVVVSSTGLNVVGSVVCKMDDNVWVLEDFKVASIDDKVVIVLLTETFVGE